MASEDARLIALRGLLGEALVTAPEELERLRADQSGHRSAAAPLALVEARSTADVQALLRHAHANGLSVVPRGAGTGLAGGAIGSRDEVVLSLARMDRILEVSPDDELAVVEPGVLTADLDAALAAHGLGFAPDPASRAVSTVGGNIATNAGGLACVKYGVTRDAVLGLSVVLADGRLLETGRRTVKGVSGYDLTSLMVGSEGTLGVIVEATVRALPRPAGQATLAADFDTVARACAAALALLRDADGARPAVLELLERRALEAIHAHLGIGSGHGAAQLLIRYDGAGAEADGLRALELLSRLGGRAVVAPDPAAAEELLRIRRSFHPAMAAQGQVLIEDVAVPRSALAAMFAEIERIEAEHGLRIPTVAHAGDGNLHPNFIVEEPLIGPDGVPIVPDAVWAAAEELFLSALRLGGTLTGEHGIGLLKRRWLGRELGEASLGLQRALKAVFDPRGVLNPGKVFL